MTVAAPPRPPEPTDTRFDDVVEALIEEARQRARRRRRTYGAVAIVLVLAAAATVVIYGSNTSFGERLGIDTAGGAGAATGAAAEELVASMHVWHGLDGGGGIDLWVYLYADGRLISTSGGGWREQRLTLDGVELVRDEIIASGLFDPDQPARGSDLVLEAQIEVRNGDRLVDVAWAPDLEWSPAFLRLVERLRNLHSWLPASAWADVEPTTYVPDRYCISALPSVLPAAAAATLSTAPLLDEITRQIDPAFYERSRGDAGGCFDLTREQAQRLAASLNAELPPNGRHLAVQIDADNTVLFVPILPHGVDECACVA